MITFSQCAAAYIENHRVGWRNGKHADQWEATLRTYAYPVFGNLPVAAVDTPLVIKVLDPIWSKKPETASRLRGRIEAVLDFATVRGYRVGANPARWKGHLKEALPAVSKLRKVKHHAALPYPEIGTFMADLRTREGGAAAALEFAILTATRTGEVIGVRWSEIDMAARVWTIPGERMKARIEHRVPLSEQALAVLRRVGAGKVNDVVFWGQQPGRSLSNMALLMMLRRMGRDDITAHGFRSTFRDWAAECTNFPNEVCEAALAHAIENKAEAAYRRGDLFDKRRNLMESWSSYCGTLAEMDRIPFSEMSDTPPPPVSFRLDEPVREKVARRIDNILGDPQGLPNGKNKRTELTPTKREKFKSELIEAVEYAHSLAARGPLPNRAPGVGRPPDNAVFIFIDDIVRACEAAGLKPGLRYIAGSESLPVRLFIELAPLLWGPVRAPRRLFERWQRWRPTLARE